MRLRYYQILLVLTLASFAPALAQKIVIGSKSDTEGYLLGEIMAQLLESRGFEVERRLGLGGTLICFEALVSGEVDLYPEYSGTIEQAILKLSHRAPLDELRRQLRRKHGLELLAPFGFNNTYALVVRRQEAEHFGLRSISDLSRVTHLHFGFSHEFLQRPDGWPGLAATYHLDVAPGGIEHGLIYKAIAEHDLDVVEVYSTDANIQRYDLVILEDDKQFFPRYLAAPLARQDLSAGARRALALLGGALSESDMIALNAQAVIDKKDFASIARSFLQERNLLREKDGGELESRRWSVLLSRTLTHIELTALAVVLAIVIAIPGGVFIYRKPSVSRPILYFTGLLQTIPSIALLAFMIPLFGIGFKPAIVALFLYALLPILRNTATALYSIDPLLKKVAVGMGLTTWQRLRHIEIPLAAPTILAGIKTAAIINIGTATLAAFIGAGGLGEPIVTGLALNDTALILEGAIPAAVLAILAEFAFELLEKAVVPKHLLQNTAH